jgi:AraC-like DNA-binding protein
MSIAISGPSQILRPYIKHFWSIENCVPKGEKYMQRLIPCGLPELMFYFDTKPKVLNPKKYFNENVVLCGQQKEFYDIQIEGSLSLFSIVFHPHGLMKFFNIPLNEINNQNIPLKYLNKKLEQELMPKMEDASDFYSRVELANKFFYDLLSENYGQFEFSRIQHVVETIKRTRGLVEIEKLASEACLSRKQFERVFCKYIGATPKQFLKTVRFQHALHLKGRFQNMNITDLAYECAYFDQSHFINEFKLQTGYTPKKYFGSNESFSDFFS